jgi:hypothetical protein
MSGDKDVFDLSHLLDPPRFGIGMAVPGLRRRYIGLGEQRYSQAPGRRHGSALLQANILSDFSGGKEDAVLLVLSI